MAAIDFPPSPIQGQQVTLAGIVYVWNGQGWIIVGGGGEGDAVVSETPPVAPNQGDLWYEADTGILWMWYDDTNSKQWVQVNGVVALTKDHPDAIEIPINPILGLDSDNVQDALAELENEKVDITGDTMTGPLVLAAAPTVDMQAANKKYVDDQISATEGLDASKFVDVAGDTMTGPLVLPADPTANLQAATKQYVDNKPAGAPPATAIPLPSAPTGAVGVATKYAREDHVHPGSAGGSTLTVSDTPPTGKPDGSLWWESDSGQLYVLYNDGNTTQWVIAAPQPDFSGIAAKKRTRTVLSSGSGTYTLPAGCAAINIRMVGGGAGGASSGTAQTPGTNGGATTFGPSLTCSGGGGGNITFGGSSPGGSSSGGDINMTGTDGSGFTGFQYCPGGIGGGTPFGPGGIGANNAVGGDAHHFGGGGGGAADVTAPSSYQGGGGAGGGYLEKLIVNPSPTYAYSIGVAGVGGTGGGRRGGNGSAGIIIIDEYY